MAVLLVSCLRVLATDCGRIPPFAVQSFDLDGDGEADVFYRQDTALITAAPPPTEKAIRYVGGLGSTRFLHSSGNKMNFAPGQSVSAANTMEMVSGFSGASLTDYYTLDFGFRFECHYMDSPRNWHTLTNGIAGIRLQSDDGFHYGWIRFARPDLEPSTPFAVVDHDWNPVPGAPIGAGEPPAFPALQTQLGETGLTLTWDARFPGLQLEWAGVLDEPVDWHAVEDAGAGTALLPPAETHRFFRLRKL